MASRSLVVVLLLCLLLVDASAQVANFLDNEETGKESAAGETEAKAGEGGRGDARESAESLTDLVEENLNLTAGDHRAQEKAAERRQCPVKDSSAAEDTVGAAKDEVAEGVSEDQGSGKTYLDMAKEKLNSFSKGVAETAEEVKDSAAGIANVVGNKAKEAKDAAANTAYSASDAVGSKAKTGKETATDVASGATGKAKEGVEYVKSTASDAASKASETSQSAKDSAVEAAESATQKSKEGAAGATDKAQGVYEATKGTVSEGVDKASDATKDAANAGLKMTSDGAEKVKNTADSAHDEL